MRLKEVIMRLKLKDFPVFKFLIIAAIVINIVQFRAIDEQANANYRALHIYEMGDLGEIGVSNSLNVRRHFATWLALGQVAPNSTIIIPSNHGFFDKSYNTDNAISRIIGLGQATTIKRVDIDISDAISGLDVKPHVVAFGEDMRPNAPMFVVAMDYDRNVALRSIGNDFIQISRATPIKTNTTFVLTHWEDVEAPFLLRHVGQAEAFRYTLLIETSLLPKDLQEELLI